MEVSVSARKNWTLLIKFAHVPVLLSDKGINVLHALFFARHVLELLLVANLIKYGL